MLHTVLTALAAAYGAATGCLIPRPAFRLAVARGEPDRTSCPAGHRLEAGRVRGWLGPTPCTMCLPRMSRAARPWRYAALGALACGGLAAAIGPRPELAVFLLAAPLVLLLAVVDVAARRLPDRLTWPLAGLLAAGLGLAALLPGSAGSWTGALAGGAGLGGCYLVLFVIAPRSLGFGDVKLALGAGLALGWYGWPAVVAGTFLCFVTAAVWAVVLLVSGRADRKDHLAFGPFIAVGAWAGLILATAL